MVRAPWSVCVLLAAGIVNGTYLTAACMKSGTARPRQINCTVVLNQLNLFVLNQLNLILLPSGDGSGANDGADTEAAARSKGSAKASLQRYRMASAEIMALLQTLAPAAGLEKVRRWRAGAFGEAPRPLRHASSGNAASFQASIARATWQGCCLLW